MKKLANFLNYIEEKILIRYGRRIWQVIGFLSILAFIASLFLVLRNLIPSTRKEVHISKKEFRENKVDRDFDESNNMDICSKADYKTALDSLKKEMPESEWMNLTKKERVERSREVQRYDPYYEYFYTSYETYYTMEEVKNYDAIPIIIEDICDSKGIDSAAYCDQIKVIRTITALMKQTQKKIATKVLKENYKGLLEYNDLQKADVERSILMYNSVNGVKPFVINPENEKDHWAYFQGYLYTYANDSISENRDYIAVDVAKQLKNNGIKKDEIQNRMVLWVLSNRMDDEATEIACSDLFQTNIFKLNDKNFIEKVNKYIDIYIEKYDLAEQLKLIEEMEKSNNIELYGSSGLVSFGTILAIASILILYSIRQVLKDKKD